MAKFDNVRVNNTVYHLLCGKGTVTKVHNLGCIKRYFSVKFKTCENDFDFDGYLINEKFEREEKIVTLYWNEIKLPAEEEDKKPFDLVEFLKKNLVPKEFKEDDDNIFLNYDYIEKRIDWDCNEIVEIMGTIYFEDVEFEKLNILVNEMNDRGVTPEQLKEAYKKLGWL